MTDPILLTGADGQLGTELLRLPGNRLVPTDRAELDITDEKAVDAFIAAGSFGGIINAAAYTAVDKAEHDVAAAWRLNATGPALLARAAARAGLPIVQISTDYVFGGDKDGFYAEDDPVAPLGVYGASKAAGEIAVRCANPRHVILRTAWLVSAHHHNFVTTMLRLGAERDEVRVVDDQIGCPTAAADLATATMAIANRLVRDAACPLGVYHFVNGGETSWCGLARAVFAGIATRGSRATKVEPIPTSAYPTPARRPANSRLATSKITADYGIIPRPWQTALDDILAETGADRGN